MKATQVRSMTEGTPEKVCMVCNKKIEGYYGTWGYKGTCSRKCEIEQEVMASTAHLQLQLAVFRKECT